MIQKKRIILSLIPPQKNSTFLIIIINFLCVYMREKTPKEELSVNFII